MVDYNCIIKKTKRETQEEKKMEKKTLEEKISKAKNEGYSAGYSSYKIGHTKRNPYGDENTPLGRVWEDEYTIGKYERKMELSE